MVESDPVSDDEVLLIRIPTFDHHLFQPPDHIASGNFRIAKDETGLSVYRRDLASEADVLTRVTRGSPDDYFLVSSTGAQVRQATRTDGTLIGFDVVADDPDGKNPGHAEIRLSASVRWTQSAAKALQRIFTRHSLP